MCTFLYANVLKSAASTQSEDARSCCGALSTTAGRQPHHRGFTLIELLMCFAITTILIGIAAPSMTEFIKQMRANQSIDLLNRAIRMTRSRAVTSNRIVSLCPYAESGCGDDWRDGIMIFDDPNNNGVLDKEEKLHEKLDLALDTFTLRWRASGGKNYLRFSPTGMARQFGRFHLCDEDNDPTLSRSILINRQGRSIRYRDTDKDGIVNDIQGNTPQC